MVVIILTPPVTLPTPLTSTPSDQKSIPVPGENVRDVSGAIAIQAASGAPLIPYRPGEPI
jgi:hypothetical protein